MTIDLRKYMDEFEFSYPSTELILRLPGATADFLDAIEPYGEEIGDGRVTVDVQGTLVNLPQDESSEKDEHLVLLKQVLVQAKADEFETVIFSD